MDNLKSLEVRMDGRIVETLAMTAEALRAFKYDTQWIADGFSISPFELPLKSDVFIANRAPFEGGICLTSPTGLDLTKVKSQQY